MKRSFTVLFAFLTLLFASITNGQNFIKVTKRNSGQTISLAKSQVLEIKLPCNPSTGYGWYEATANNNKNKSIVQTGDWEFVPGSNHVRNGQPGYQIIRYTGHSQGTTKLELEYRRPWEKNIAAFDFYKITIVSGGKYTGTYTPPAKQQVAQNHAKSLSTLPSSFSWKSQCTPIKDQGQCGSCWVFAATGTFEANINIIDGNTRSLSEQWIINCATDDGDGCQGGGIPFDHYVSPGCVYESDLPYADGACNVVYGGNADCLGTCGTYPTHETMNSWAYVAGENSHGIPPDTAIKRAIYKYGPVYISIDAGNNFQNYTGGVFTTTDGTVTDHAVVLVGWVDSTAISSGGYWILRNSWGDGWGESGYMKIAYGVSAAGSYAAYIVYKGGVPSCAGAPNPGNTVSSKNPVCSTDVFTLSLQNFSGTGVTYQWQSSPDDSTWSNISGATDATLVTSQTVSTYYRCNVNCSGITGASNPLQVTMTSTLCYCLGTYSYCGSSFGIDITNVTFGSINNTTASNCWLPNNYSDYTGLSTTVSQGLSYPISVSSDYDLYTIYWGIWVDWNNSGSFTDNANKYTVINNNSHTSLTGTGTIVVPAGATFGSHRMRIRANHSSPGQANACANLVYGEQEDYTVNVIACTPVTPSVIITASANPICTSMSVTFTATPTNGGSSPSYQWIKNGSNVGSNSTTYTNTSPVNGDQIYCVMISNASCANPTTATSNTITVTVNSYVVPSVSVAASSNPACSGSTVTFTATPTNGGASPSYQWKLNNVNTGTNSSVYTNSSLANGDKIKCVMTSNYSCVSPAKATSNIVTMTIHSNVTPSVSITASANPICSGTSVTFNATPTNGGASPSYQWKLNGSNVGTNSSAYSNSSLVNGDQISCMMTSSATCPNPAVVTSNIITTTVKVVPVASAGSNSPICATSTINLTSSGGGTYNWTGPNGFSSSFQNPSINNATTSANGNYIVTVSSSNGCTASASTAVIVTAQPAVNITPNGPTTFCPGGTVTLTATTGSAYLWSTGSTDQSIIVSTSGVYSVTVTIGSCPGTASITVNVNPIVILSATTTTICASASTTITASGATSYSWSNGPGTGSSITVSPAITTIYTVTGTTNGCTNTASITITVNSKPTVTATSSQLPFCKGYNTTLTGLGASTYSWSNNLGTGNSKIVSPISTTTYYVTGTDINGCTNTASVTVTVISLTPVTVSKSPATICAGGTSTLTAANASTYAWDNGLGAGNPQVVAPVITTTYTVTGTATSGCTSTAKVTLTVNPQPVLTITATKSSICTGASTTLTVTGATSSYNWSGGLGGGSQKTVTPTLTTTYTVTGTNTTGCTNTASIVITVNPKPTVAVTASAAAICKGDTSILTANGADTYVWNNSISPGNPVVVAPATTTVYKVTGTTAFGCSSTAKVTLTVNPIPIVTATANPSTINSGASSTLTAGGASTYSWSNGLGSGNPKIVTPLITTSYTVTGSNSTGCSNTANAAVIVNSKSMMTEPDTAVILQGKAFHDCYPNPFNDKTVVRFLLPSDNHARVDVFDITGKRIQTLFDAEVKGQWEYKVEFDGTSIPDNIYIYRITTNDEVFTGKMILNKE